MATVDDNSVGAQLRDARKKKNLTLEQVERDIFISIRLIKALEDERYEEFSSEVYLVGFLKSYTAYLGLDSDQVIQRFKNMSLQEQPTPNELLQQQKSSAKPALIAIVATVVLVGVLVLLGQPFFLGYFDSIVEGVWGNRPQAAETTDLSTVYSLENDFLEQELEEGDKIGISIGEQFYVIEVSKIARRVTLQSKDEQFTLQNNERITTKLDPNASEEIEILVQNIVREQEPPRVALRVTVRRDESVAEAGAGAGAGAGGVAAAAEGEFSEDYGGTTIASRRRAPTDLGQIDSALTFPVQISFTAPVFLQYQVDASQPVERLYDSQDIITLQPRQRLAVWTTNAGAVNFNVINRFIPIGELGEVTSFVVEKDADSLANNDVLRIVPLY